MSMKGIVAHNNYVFVYGYVEDNKVRTIVLSIVIASAIILLLIGTGLGIFFCCKHM